METKFTKSTDKEHKIKLESSILHATWSANEVHAGSEALIGVKTLFVGEGGKIKVTGKSEKGKKLGKLSGKVYGNGFSGKLTIPEKIKPGDMAYFEVKLPGLGAKAESNHVPIRPKIVVSNMKWDKKEARRGDILKLSGDIEGVKDEAEVKVIIYEHDQDGNHDRIIEIPTNVKSKKVEVEWEYEYHDTTENIPSEDELQQHNKKKHYAHPQYYFVMQIDDEEYGIKQESGLLKFRDWIELRPRDINGDPAPGLEYIVYFADGSKKKGKLDDAGCARLEEVPPGPVNIKYIIDQET